MAVEKIRLVLGGQTVTLVVHVLENINFTLLSFISGREGSSSVYWSRLLTTATLCVNSEHG